MDYKCQDLFVVNQEGETDMEIVVWAFGFAVGIIFSLCIKQLFEGE